MIKRIAVLSLIVLLASFIFVVAAPKPIVIAATPVQLYVDPPSIVNQTLVSGTTFNVTVRVANIPADPGLVGVEFNVTWDPTILKGVAMQEIMFHQVTPSDQWNNIWALTNDVANNSVAYAYTFQNIGNAETGGYAPINGSHTVANITLKVVGVGKCPLHFYVSKLGDPSGNPLTHDTIDGFFNNIVPPPPPPAALLSVDPAKITNSSLTNGTTFSVNINITNATNLGGLEFKLGFNASVLNALSVNAGGIAFTTTKTQIDNSTGFILFNASSVPPINVTGTAAVVQFTVLANGTKNSPLHLYNVTLVDDGGNALPFNTADGNFTNMKIIPGDVNGDGIVDIYDAIEAAKAFGSTPGSPSWNPAADQAPPFGQIDIFDIILIGMNFGQKAS